MPAAVEAFYANEIGVGHALLLAKLPTDQQQQALSACFKELYNGSRKPARVLLPVRNLQSWIESNVLLVLKDAPFDKRDAQLVPRRAVVPTAPSARTTIGCFSRTTLESRGIDALIPNATNRNLRCMWQRPLQPSRSLCRSARITGAQKEGSPVLPRNKYTAIRGDKPKSNDEARRPEFKVCKFTTDAIVTEGSEVGALYKVCTNPACRVHHPKKASDAQFKAEQENRLMEEAIANATGQRVLSAISVAVPVRLMKRDLLFVAERVVNLLDENRTAILAKQHGIKKAKRNDSISKLFAVFLHRADESTLGHAVVEAVVLLTASRGNASHVLRDAAEFYKVDMAAITARVKQEFAAKEKAKTAKKVTAKPPAKAQPKAAKKAAA